MTPERSLLVPIGLHNDCFARDRNLRGVMDEASSAVDVVGNPVRAIERLAPLPMALTSDDREVPDDTKGILETIKDETISDQPIHDETITDARPSCSDSPGPETMRELQAFSSRIQTVPGKHGINAFSNTVLDELLAMRGIHDVIHAGAVTSVCIHSTGGSASERNLGVHILRDCTSARTLVEQELHRERIFPVDAQVPTAADCLAKLGVS